MKNLQKYETRKYKVFILIFVIIGVWLSKPLAFRGSFPNTPKDSKGLDSVM